MYKHAAGVPRAEQAPAADAARRRAGTRLHAPQALPRRPPPRRQSAVSRAQRPFCAPPPVVPFFKAGHTGGCSYSPGHTGEVGAARERGRQRRWRAEVASGWDHARSNRWAWRDVARARRPARVRGRVGPEAMTGRSWLSRAAAPGLGAARRALLRPSVAGAPPAAHAGCTPSALPAALMLRRPPLCTPPRAAAAAALTSGSTRGCPVARAGAALLRRMSMGPGQGASADGSELDPYLPHRINYEKAKDYIKEHVSKGMTREDVVKVVQRAMELHIPPVPSLEVRSVATGLYVRVRTPRAAGLAHLGPACAA